MAKGEKPETYYIPCEIDAFGQIIWTGGLLYEENKGTRSDLRLATLLTSRKRPTDQPFIQGKLHSITN